jgi:hypothetical protein
VSAYGSVTGTNRTQTDEDTICGFNSEAKFVTRIDNVYPGSAGYSSWGNAGLLYKQTTTQNAPDSIADRNDGVQIKVRGVAKYRF